MYSLNMFILGVQYTQNIKCKSLQSFFFGGWGVGVGVVLKLGHSIAQHQLEEKKA